MAHAREHWGTKLGFIMAAIGSAIGLGTLWWFPYVTGMNGGGAFVLIYLIATVCIGIPTFMTELMLGRRAQKGTVGTFSILSHRTKHWKMLGWFSFFVPFLIATYYFVVAGWALNYVFLSLSNFAVDKTPEQIGGVFDALYSSGSISTLWQFLFIAIVTGMLYQGVQKGIEYWAKIMTIGLLIMLTVLLIFSASLDGFGEAVRFIVYPRWGALRPSGVLLALGLSLFTLSLGHGVMLTYGSYMQKGDDIPKTAFIVGISDVLISIMGALMIFPIVFTFGFEPDQQAGLIFKTLPLLFARVPGTLVVSTLFFVMLVFVALTSAISIQEVLVANLIDVYNFTRKKAALWSGLAIFIFGIPCALSGSGALFPQWKEMYGETYFDTVSNISGTWFLPIIALFTSIFAGWVVPRADMSEEFNAGSTMSWLFPIWRTFTRWVIPAIIIFTMLQQSGIINVDQWFQ